VSSPSFLHRREMAKENAMLGDGQGAQVVALVGVGMMAANVPPRTGGTAERGTSARIARETPS
jgi:hypothetical protein